MMKLYSYQQFVNKINEQFSISNKLFEGGAQGHLAHIADDLTLTFLDLKDIIKMLMEEGLSPENALSEKIDGAQLSFSWKAGRVICARNKSHLKNFGENALTLESIKELFKGRGLLEDAFVFAVSDLVSNLGKLSNKELTDIFEEGKKFMSIEILYSKTENSIPYGVDLLGFHGLIEYDETGSPIGSMDKSQAIKLAKMLKDVNANVGRVYNIDGPNPLQIIKQSDFSEKAETYMQDVVKLQNEFDLKDSDEVGKYHYTWFKNYVINKAKSFEYDISEDLLDKISRRFGLLDKGAIKATEFKNIENKKFADWISEFKDSEATELYNENMEKFNLIFLKVGVDVLKSLSNYMTLDKDVAKSEMKKTLDVAIENIKKVNDESKVKLMVKHLKRIEELGGIDEITPTEGVVFFYKGKMFKIVGLFQSFHRIVSTLKF